MAGGFVSFQSPAKIENSSIVIPGISSASGLTKAGFAVTNSGTILRSFSNVKMDGGWGFAKENTGIIKNCYGWAWGADQFPTLSRCSYTYFIEGNSGAVQLYDMDGTISGKVPDTDVLADPLALSILNAGGNNSWKRNTSDGYPYPLLANQDHRGNYAAPVSRNYPYALRYVETYTDGTGDLIVIYDQDHKITNIVSNLRDATISGTAYYLYHRTESDLVNSNLLGTFTSGSATFDAGWERMEELNTSAAPELFTAYQLMENTSYDTLNLQTYYPLYSAAGNYRIRTGPQFRNIAKNSGATFYLDHHITVSDTVSSFEGTLYGNGHTISAQVPLFESVGANAVIENCHVDTTSDFQPFGNLPGNEISATHWTANYQATANVDHFETTFMPVTETPMAVSLSLTGCTVNGESPLATRHYYNVDTGTIQLIPGDSVSVEFAEVQGLTYRDLATTNTIYYVVSTYGTSYEPLSITLAESGSLILTSDTLHLEKVPDQLDTMVEILLYTINGGIPNDTTGPCCLMVNGQYLAGNGALLDAWPEDSSCIWTGNGDGSYSNSDATIVAYTSGGYFITSSKFSGEFTVQELIRTYACSYVGEASVIPNP